MIKFLMPIAKLVCDGYNTQSSYKQVGIRLLQALLAKRSNKSTASRRESHAKKNETRNQQLSQNYGKGQLISKCLFGIFNSSRKKPTKFDFTTMVLQVKMFLFVFWENLKHQNDISKLTDLQQPELGISKEEMIMLNPFHSGWDKRRFSTFSDFSFWSKASQ